MPALHVNPQVVIFGRHPADRTGTIFILWATDLKRSAAAFEAEFLGVS